MEENNIVIAASSLFFFFSCTIFEMIISFEFDGYFIEVNIDNNDKIGF